VTRFAHQSDVTEYKFEFALNQAKAYIRQKIAARCVRKLGPSLISKGLPSSGLVPQ